VASPYKDALLHLLPTGTFTLQDTPSLSRRDMYHHGKQQAVVNPLFIGCPAGSGREERIIYGGSHVDAAADQGNYSKEASEMIVISPMVAPNAIPVVEKLGIRVYSSAEDVKL